MGEVGDGGRYAWVHELVGDGPEAWSVKQEIIARDQHIMYLEDQLRKARQSEVTEQVTDTGEREEHLRPARSDRGFARLPVITGTYPGIIQTYESSGASRPQVWVKVTQPTDLNKPEGPWHDATVHLTVEAATQFAEQLLFLVEHHYQTCDRAKREQALAAASPPEDPATAPRWVDSWRENWEKGTREA